MKKETNFIFIALRTLQSSSLRIGLWLVVTGLVYVVPIIPNDPTLPW